MVPDIRWIKTAYRFFPYKKLGVQKRLLRRLREMADDVLATNSLVAIYIPESAPPEYVSENLCGRIVGAVRLLPMPPGMSEEDFADPSEAERWPVGWPCELIYSLGDNGPMLRDLVEGSFADFAVKFRQQGPLRLDSSMRAKLGRVFEHIEPLVGTDPKREPLVHTGETHIEKFIYWKGDRFWLGYLQEFPDYWTQGETLEDLKEHLRDLYLELTGGHIPGVRKVDELVIA